MQFCFAAIQSTTLCSNAIITSDLIVPTFSLNFLDPLISSYTILFADSATQVTIITADFFRDSSNTSELNQRLQRLKAYLILVAWEFGLGSRA